MAQMNRIKSNLQTLESVISKLETGQLMQQDLETLVELTRDMYEISLILRHKAYEEHVFGTAPASSDVSVTFGDQIDEPTNERSLDFTQLETEENISANTFPQNEPPQPVFEFNLFDEPASPIEESFDEEIPEEMPIPFIESVETSVFETEEDSGNHEFDTETESEESIEFSETGTNGEFMNRFSVVNLQFTNQLGMSRLETLIGSFGLNERLQYINELFDGSSEALSNAVKALDSVSSYSEALLTIAQLADQYQWDLSSDTVEEFMVKIQRRHV